MTKPPTVKQKPKTKKASPPRHTYQTLMSQLNARMSKYHMPEYIRKVREDYEEKLHSNNDNQHLIRILEKEKDLASPKNFLI
jgi:hypothetical protein